MFRFIEIGNKYRDNWFELLHINADCNESEALELMMHHVLRCLRTYLEASYSPDNASISREHLKTAFWYYFTAASYGVTSPHMPWIQVTDI